MPDYDSPFFITNDRTYIDQDAIEDGSAVVWPLSDDAKLVRSPDRQYCGNYVTYGDKSAATYRHNDDTHDLIAAGPNQHRDMVSSFPLVKTLTKAQARGDRQLLDVQDQDVRITTRLENVPITRATLAKAGMRLQIKGTHWGPTCDDWHYARIVTAEPQPHGAGELCDISLELVMGMPVESSLSSGPPVAEIGTAGGILYQPGDLGSESTDTEQQVFWVTNGDHPGAGYGVRAIDGTHFAYTGTLGSQEGFTILAATGTLDLNVQFTLTDVSASRTWTAELRKNGSVIASDLQSYSGGLTSHVLTFGLDVSGVPVVAGDELTTWILASAAFNPAIPAGSGSTDNVFEILATSTVTP